jgi:NADPH:quinone reductase-like Zn-dependent oxidoreductase
MAISVIAPEFGGPEVLVLVESELPEPGDGEVAIRVVAAGVNPIDVKRVRGTNSKVEPPLRVGSEISGVVTAIGPNAIGAIGPLAVGDEVVTTKVSGGLSTEVIVKADGVLPKPATLSWDDAAGLLLTGGTAVHLLEATAVRDGDTVLIHGASGSVGILAGQLAVMRGARVIGTASERNHDLLTRFGIEPVEYGDGLVERVRALAPDGIDVALDTVGTTEAIDASVALVADRGRIATIAAFQYAGELGGIAMLGGGPGADPGTELRRAARPELVRLASEGELTVVLGPSFPLERVSEAFALVASGHAGGKVIVHP